MELLAISAINCSCLDRLINWTCRALREINQNSLSSLAIKVNKYLTWSITLPKTGLHYSWIPQILLRWYLMWLTLSCLGVKPFSCFIFHWEDLMKLSQQHPRITCHAIKVEIWLRIYPWFIWPSTPSYDYHVNLLSNNSISKTPWVLC